MHPLFSILVGGILPFGAVFIELFFILTSIWLHQFYYLFGFLFVVFLILIVTCAEITIVMCYFQLCSEVRPPDNHSSANRAIMVRHGATENGP
jgi:transmembrane 9 superfamily protein 2/4